MGSYINVGAFIKDESGELVRPKSKKAVRDAMATDPSSVYFDKTAVAFDGPGGFAGDDLPQGKILSLVGPDPYTKRNFYGSVMTKVVKGQSRVVVE